VVTFVVTLELAIYQIMKVSFKVAQFKSPSHNALNDHNLEYFEGNFLGSHTSSGVDSVWHTSGYPHTNCKF